MYYSAMLIPPTMKEMRILIINGPNLNLLGMRRPEIYGRETFGETLAKLRKRFGKVTLEYFQSNSEGAIVGELQRLGYDEAGVDGIVLNAAAYTHTSLAIADAISAIPQPVVEVHLSNVYAREEIRRRSLIAPVCAGSISGFGAAVYSLAVRALM